MTFQSPAENQVPLRWRPPNIRSDDSENGRGLDKVKKTGPALRSLALQLWQNGCLDEAIGTFALARNEAPRDAALLADFGRALWRAGRKAEAMRQLNESLHIDPNEYRTWLSAAEICNEIGDKKTAEQSYLVTLDLQPDTVAAAAGLGMLYFELRRYKEAAHYLENAARNAPSKVFVEASLAQALFFLGDFTASANMFERLAASRPDDPDIIRKYALGRLIEGLINGPTESALEIFDRIIEKSDETRDIACATAFQALCGFGHFEAANRLGAEMLVWAPHDPIIRYHLDAIQGKAPDRTPNAYLTKCFDKYAPGFDRHLVEALGYHVPETLCSRLLELDVGLDRVLDLGCGTGLAGRHLASFRASITGVDISQGMLEVAQAGKFYSELAQDDILTYLAKEERQFDLVVALDVLIYFGSLESLFAFVATRLAPGGLFAFSFEIAKSSGVQFQQTGRFSHSVDYIETCLGDRFLCISDSVINLRLEANEPVPGRLMIVKRQT